MISLSPTTSRIAALGILLLVVLLPLFYGLIPLVTSYLAQAAEIRLQQRALNHYRFLVDNRDAISAELAALQAKGEAGDLFLKGSKKAIASADLRAYVNEAVQRSGGQLVSSQEYEAAAIAATTPVGLRLQIAGEVGNLVALLYELENALPLINVERLTVTSAAFQQREALRGRASNRGPGSNRAARAKAQVQRYTLDIRLDIVGYMPGEAS